METKWYSCQINLTIYLIINIVKLYENDYKQYIKNLSNQIVIQIMMYYKSWTKQSITIIMISYGQ